MDTAEFPQGGSMDVPSPRKGFVGIHCIVPEHMMGCLGQELDSIILVRPFCDIPWLSRGKRGKSHSGMLRECCHQS